MTLHSEHPAVVDGRTLFPSTVREPDGSTRLLKSGHNNAKLGKTVEKGAWAGMPLYSLSLEERATCPRTCQEWANCYGNRMPFAQRFKSGKVLEKRLEREIASLAAEHCYTGFVVRLHVLGDFYSANYVALWARLLKRHPGMRVFGYTARQPRPSGRSIGRLLMALRQAYPQRFVIRLSGTEAITVPGQLLVPEGAIVCPAQTAQSLCCATCGLCWTATEKVIAFVAH